MRITGTRRVALRAATIAAMGCATALGPAGLAPAAERSGPAGAAARGVPRAGGVQRISDERTVTWWAYADNPGAIVAQPGAGQPVVGHLHLNTEDGLPEVYEILAQKVTPRLTWFQIRILGRPNGRVGWVSEDSLGALHQVHTSIVVSSRTLRLSVFVRGRRVFSAPIGLGKGTTPTPGGHFYVREKFRTARNQAVYGPYAMGTSDYSTLTDWPHGGVVGIHGTSAPQLIPGRPSHGCIRLRNGAMTRLYRLVPIGTPLIIL